MARATIRWFSALWRKRSEWRGWAFRAAWRRARERRCACRRSGWKSLERNHAKRGGVRGVSGAFEPLGGEPANAAAHAGAVAGNRSNATTRSVAE